jgi:uncharacterized protein YbdZ (MbtH family)
MRDNRVLCYSVKIVIPNEAGPSESVYYLVQTNSEAAAIEAVKEAVPSAWRVAAVNPAAVRTETVDYLDLRPGIPRQI